MAELIIISNRLPVSVRKTQKGIEVYPSSGGLATGLSGYTKQRGTKWIGWAGLPSDDLSDNDKRLIASNLKRYHCYPVFLTQKQINEYYNGYSNGVLWPLFHDLTVSSGNTSKNWKAYQLVNQLFAKVALALSGPDSTLWVHDYQLMLVPKLLRIERPNDHIGFFLHIPFPAPSKLADNARISHLVAGVLGADLVGFHTNGYAQNFLQSCREQKLGDITNDQVIIPGRTIRVAEFPMGIDYHKFAHATRQREVDIEHRKLARKYRGQKVIVTVDRLDPAKGLVERLEAYEQLLAESPELHGRVTLLMQVIPSREEIAEYAHLKQRIEEVIERVNSTFNTRNWQPVEYLYKTVPFEQLVAMYRRADIAFIAPFRDGMNLVAKEYLASQQRRGGVLVLSQTAGAATELKAAIKVDPAKPKTLVQGLRQALALPVADRQQRLQAMRRHLQQFTVQHWADTFMNELQRPQVTRLSRTRTLNDTRESILIESYHQAKRRLLLLDYDGVLRKFERTPAAAKPTGKLLRLLERLGNTPGTDVVIISGRSKADLQNWFGALPISLAAEHGALFKRKGGKNWHKTTSSDPGWRHPISVILKRYVDKTPGTFIEQKEWATVWHYRNSSPYRSQKSLVALRRVLTPLAKEYGLRIIEGHKVLELRPADVHKGRIAQEWLASDYDFVLAIGDDTTDEDMFATIPPGGNTIKVGRGTTLAGFRVADVPAVLHLLSKF